MSSPPVDGYQIQTYTIEFDVPGNLDGLTLSPPIVAPQRNDDPQQIYRPPVRDNLGLIDVDYIVTEVPPGQPGNRRGARGNRFIPWIWIESPVAGSAGAVLEVVDAIDGSVSVQENIADLSGLTEFYQRTGILMPQGSMLRISGFTGGGPKKVRLGIQYINGLKELAAVQEALCCAELTGGGVAPRFVAQNLGPFVVVAATPIGVPPFLPVVLVALAVDVPAGLYRIGYSASVGNAAGVGEGFVGLLIDGLPPAGTSFYNDIPILAPATAWPAGTRYFNLTEGTHVITLNAAVSSVVLPYLMQGQLELERIP